MLDVVKDTPANIVALTAFANPRGREAYLGRSKKKIDAKTATLADFAVPCRLRRESLLDRL